MIFWMMPDNAAHTQAMMESFLQDFSKENPDTPVEIRVINRRTLWAKIFALKDAYCGPDCPDLIAIPHYWTELMAKNGAIENITELDKTLRVDGALDILKPHSYKTGGADIYSVPWWFDITALHYREDHLALVTKNPSELLSTWQGLLEACRLLKEHFEGVEGYYPVQNNDWRGSLSSRSSLPCLWSRGAKLFDEKKMTGGFFSPEFEAGIEDFIQLAIKGYMPILRERSSLGTITSGKSSIVMTRRQGISMFEGDKRNIPVKTISVPRTGAHAVNYLGGVNLAVVKGGGDKQGALKLLKWISSTDKQLKYTALTEVFPAAEAGFEQYLLSSPVRMQSYTHIIAESMALPNNMVSGTVMEVLGALLSALAAAIVKNKYSKDLLKAEIKKAGAEVAEILRLYKD